MNPELVYYSKTAQPSTYATLALWNISRVRDLLYLVAKLLRCCSNILRSLKHWSQSAKSQLLIIVGVFMKKKCQMFPIVKIFEVITVDFDAQFQKSEILMKCFCFLKFYPWTAALKKIKKQNAINVCSKESVIARHPNILSRFWPVRYMGKDLLYPSLCSDRLKSSQ